MTISKQAHAYLEQLRSTGLFGTTVDEVMERLICEQIRVLLKERVLPAADMAPAGRKCPRCGSPKMNDISAHGTVEFQCTDCDFRIVEEP